MHFLSKGVLLVSPPARKCRLPVLTHSPARGGSQAVWPQDLCITLEGKRSPKDSGDAIFHQSAEWGLRTGFKLIERKLCRLFLGHLGFQLGLYHVHMHLLPTSTGGLHLGPHIYVHAPAPPHRHTQMSVDTQAAATYAAGFFLPRSLRASASTGDDFLCPLGRPEGTCGLPREDLSSTLTHKGAVERSDGARPGQPLLPASLGIPGPS